MAGLLTWSPALFFAAASVAASLVSVSVRCTDVLMAFGGSYRMSREYASEVTGPRNIRYEPT